MIAGVPTMNFFGVRLTTQRVDVASERATVRCDVEHHRLQAASDVALGSREVADLLDQVEQQYTNFGQTVAWVGAERAAGTLHLSWSLNSNGHAQGRYTLSSPTWRIEGDLDGDQSYLPTLALGLRLLLRALRGEPL